MSVFPFSEASALAQMFCEIFSISSETVEETHITI